MFGPISSSNLELVEFDVSDSKHDLLSVLEDLSAYEPTVAGGAVRAFLEDRPITSDIDLFFTCPVKLEQCAAFLGTPIRESKPALTFSYRGYEIQLVRFYHPTVEGLLDSFDYTICQFAIRNGVLYAPKEALFDLLQKRLMVHKIKLPVASMRRMLKYAKEFHVPNQCMLDYLELVRQMPDLPEEAGYLTNGPDDDILVVEDKTCTS